MSTSASPRSTLFPLVDNIHCRPHWPMYVPKDSKLGPHPQMLLPGFPMLSATDFHTGLPTPPSPKDNPMQFPSPLLLAQMGFPIPHQLLGNMYQYPPLQTNQPRDKKDKSNHRIASDDNSRKRKHSECEGALDLSVKKVRNSEYVPKTDHTDVRTNSLRCETPIDYSVRSQQICHKQKDTHSDNRRLVSTQHSVHTHGYPAQSVHNSHKTRLGNHSSDAAWTDSSKRQTSSCTCGRSNADDDIRSWTVDRVCSFLTYLDGCSQYSKTFREQGISGRLLPFLTTQHLTRTLGMKVGPALTLMQAVERRFRETVTSAPCSYCNSRTTAYATERAYSSMTMT